MVVVVVVVFGCGTDGHETEPLGGRRRIVRRGKDEAALRRDRVVCDAHDSQAMVEGGDFRGDDVPRRERRKGITIGNRGERERERETWDGDGHGS